MYANRRQLLTQDSPSWTWYVMPLVMVAALGAFLMPLGQAGADVTATEAAPTEFAAAAQQLAPAPQPGMGEPELFAADLPQSY